MLPSETMIWQPEFTDKTLSRKPGAVHSAHPALFLQVIIQRQCQKRSLPEDAAKHALRSARA
ncbi:hypothetical protein FPI65_14920 [Escherichia coli]|uniref:Uncharacterized protein n=1 Tax=Escherichia coli TaxID=562 RepID=A0A6N9S8X4_ECOLX|nr:hypothetical protein [Escherichia coli]NDR92531.1 hypothetical protein [Escherichia coli]HAH3880563.1 hypothetical protein [Escherichia coli]